MWNIIDGIVICEKLRHDPLRFVDYSLFKYTNKDRIRRKKKE